MLLSALTRKWLWCSLPKSDLTEKLPFAETRGFAGFGAAICRVGCGVGPGMRPELDRGNCAVIRSGFVSGWRTCPLLWNPICPVASGLKQTHYRLWEHRPLFGKISIKSRNNGGAGGIRTLDTLLTYTHFPGERLRPLGHRSACSGRRLTIAPPGFSQAGSS